MSTRLAFTSRTTERLDALAVKHGWERIQNREGSWVTYNRQNQSVIVGVSVVGAVTRASNNGYHAVGSGKADCAAEWLSS